MSNTAEIARAMATTMENAAIPMYGKKLRLPDRSAIIALLKELRRLFFPAYFGDPQLMALPAENYAALLLERIETGMTAQIALALPDGETAQAAQITELTVEPLFTRDDYKIYDQYSDGDPFEDEAYIKHFRLMLSAIQSDRPVQMTMVNRHGKEVRVRFYPKGFEYSLKDDKIRILAAGCKFRQFNLGRVVSCDFYNGNGPWNEKPKAERRKDLTLLITDERNALERAMLHFAHFEKQAERTDEIGQHTAEERDRRCDVPVCCAETRLRPADNDRQAFTGRDKLRVKAGSFSALNGNVVVVLKRICNGVHIIYAG